MANFHDRTAAPVCQRGLLRAGGRPCVVLGSTEVVALTAETPTPTDFSPAAIMARADAYAADHAARLELRAVVAVDPRSVEELLEEIRREIDRQESLRQVAAKSEQPSEPLLSADVRHGGARAHMCTTEDTGSADRCSAATNHPDHIGVVADQASAALLKSGDLKLETISNLVADQIRHDVVFDLAETGDLKTARTIHLRRQLAQAAEHGAALLAALGLPRLVGTDPVVLDSVAIGDALDLAIATLDVLDSDAEAEPWLGWSGAAIGAAVMGGTLDLEAEDLDERPLGWADNVSQVALDHGSEDGDLTAPERAGKGFVRCGADDAEDSDPAERDDEPGSEDGEDIGHHASQFAPRPLTPKARAEVAVMAARAAQVRRTLHV